MRFHTAHAHNNLITTLLELLHWYCTMYNVEDRYTTQTVLKPPGWFYKWLASFKTGWPALKQAGPIWNPTFTLDRFKTEWSVLHAACSIAGLASVVFHCKLMPLTLLQLAWYVPSPRGPDLLVKRNRIAPVHDVEKSKPGTVLKSIIIKTRLADEMMRWEIASRLVSTCKYSIFSPCNLDSKN